MDQICWLLDNEVILLGSISLTSAIQGDLFHKLQSLYLGYYYFCGLSCKHAVDTNPHISLSCLRICLHNWRSRFSHAGCFLLRDAKIVRFLLLEMRRALSFQKKLK